MGAIDQWPTIPLSYKDPPDSPIQVRVLAKWDLFLGAIAAGLPIQDAMMKFLIKRAEIEACVRLGPEQRQRWNQARLAAKKTKFSAFDLEEIFDKIANGSPVTRAVNEVMNPNVAEPADGSSCSTDFMSLCTQDDDFKQHFEVAVRARALHVGEQILDISDGDGRGDYLDNGKGGFTPDGAKVNRDKLRVETRRALMSSWYPKLFGEKKGDVQVNVQINHAARLEEARSRRTSRSANKIPQKLIEATFKDAPAAAEPEKADWDDVPATAAESTVWREES